MTRELPLETSCAEVHQLMSVDNEVVLLDCRERDEYALVALPNTLLMPMSEIASRIHEITEMQNRRVIVVCHHGQRSALVAAWLRERGFVQAQSMAGGIDRWAVEIEPGLNRY